MKSRTGFFIYKYVVSDEIIYIGITTDIVRRIHKHERCRGIDSKFKPYIDKADIYVHECSKESEMRALETILIDIYKPVLNVSGRTDVPCSLSPLDDYVSWGLYNEGDYKETRPPSIQHKEGRTSPQHRYGKETRKAAREGRAMLQRALEIIHAFPSLFEPLCMEIETPLQGRKNRFLWSAYDHLPEDVCRGRTEWDVNVVFAQVNLASVFYRYVSCTGVIELCNGVYTIEDDRGYGKPYIILNMKGINRLLACADEMFEKYNKILEDDDASEKEADIRIVPECSRYLLKEKETDLPDVICWESIKHFYQ